MIALKRLLGALESAFCAPHIERAARTPRSPFHVEFSGVERRCVDGRPGVSRRRAVGRAHAAHRRVLHRSLSSFRSSPAFSGRAAHPDLRSVAVPAAADLSAGGVLLQRPDGFRAQMGDAGHAHDGPRNAHASTAARAFLSSTRRRMPCSFISAGCCRRFSWCRWSIRRSVACTTCWPASFSCAGFERAQEFGKEFASGHSSPTQSVLALRSGPEAWSGKA